MANQSQLRSSAIAISQSVIIDMDACRQLATWLKHRNIPLDREDTSLHGMSREQVGSFYLLLVAICHQTSPRGKPPLEGMIDGKNLRGWDYLSAKLESEIKTHPELLTPDEWANISTERVRELFRDEKLGDRLSEPERRAALIRDLGQKMLKASWHSAEDLFKYAGAQIAQGDHCLLTLLSRFRAYDDPVQKKSFFFLAVMRNSGLWSYLDSEHLGAPVDYHEVRGHLRLGTVKILDPELYKILLVGGEVTAEEDIKIRSAVHQVIMFLSKESELHNPSQLHYLFWNVFRSCCLRESPHCFSCPTSCSLPHRYVPLKAQFEGSISCPFSPICQSAKKEPKLLDYRFDTDYY